MKRFVIGDIHGAHLALVQCLERSGFKRQDDLLISLGDLCDGWPDVDKVMDEFLTIEHIVLLLGNHDQWLLDWFNTGSKPDIWLSQGGNTTMQSFYNGVSNAHKQLLNKARLFYKLENKLFVHGGYIPDKPVEDQGKDILLWDRTLVHKALSHRARGESDNITPYDTVFVGHTPTLNYGKPEIIHACGICMMDTGAGWPGGVLTMLNIDTGEYYSSDKVDQLYGNFKGR